MAYKSYFDDKYGSMEQDYAMPEQQAQAAPMSSGSGTQGLQQAGAASGNPYAMGASFILNYMDQKQKEFEAKRAQEMQLSQNYANMQDKGLQSLGSYWAKALRR